MDQTRINKAAAVLVAARKERRLIGGLPEDARPRSVAEAHATQDAVTALLGAEISAYKANAPANGDRVRAPIYAANVRPSPARFPVAEVPHCGIEGEIAFKFRRDLPPRAEPYTRDEVAAAVDACPAIEILSSRFADPKAMEDLDKLADGIGNGGFAYGAIVPDWRALDITKLKVRLTVNGETIVEQVGGHPIGDPLAVAVALVDLMRTGTGVKAGQYVTTGTCTGARYFKPGDTCVVTFEGLGSAELQFVP
jgi:2-keto-4-pentenoate hydratase